jgi:hypothetical protein
LAGEGKSERGKFCGKFASSFWLGKGKKAPKSISVEAGSKRYFMKTSNVGIYERLGNGLKDGSLSQLASRLNFHNSSDELRVFK